ncbi:hypothetical protein Ptr902_00728 [Pyrenophora tritici-repentis]|nr:hypothetical protein Ptr902_00728 [Pyrenophora tritici-repentis]
MWSPGAARALTTANTSLAQTKPQAQDALDGASGAGGSICPAQK